jgi:hypothetical protein
MEEHRMACLRLRAKDLECERRALIVREGEDVKTAKVYACVLNHDAFAAHSRLE